MIDMAEGSILDVKRAAQALATVRGVERWQDCVEPKAKPRQRLFDEYLAGDFRISPAAPTKRESSAPDRNIGEHSGSWIDIAASAGAVLCAIAVGLIALSSIEKARQSWPFILVVVLALVVFLPRQGKRRTDADKLE